MRFDAKAKNQYRYRYHYTATANGCETHNKNGKTTSFEDNSSEPDSDITVKCNGASALSEIQFSSTLMQISLFTNDYLDSLAKQSNTSKKAGSKPAF